MSNESAVRSVLQYIRDNLNEDLTLEKIAKELNYSRFYIARAFAEIRAVPYINTFRGGGLRKRRKSWYIQIYQLWKSPVKPAIVPSRRLRWPFTSCMDVRRRNIE